MWNRYQDVKKSSNCVLALLRDSTYGAEYASPLRSLRPCWMAFFNILWAMLIQFVEEYRVSNLVFHQLLRYVYG
jgi:hypothetical protein